MGAGIAQVCAALGYTTILYDLNASVLEAARARTEGDLSKLLEKGKITPEKKESTLSLLHFTADVSQCRADLVIEAIIENAEAKISLFRQLAEHNAPHTVYVSNTSSLSVSSLAAETEFPERVAGLHFFNPAPVMKLVEVVRGKQTDEAVMNALVHFTKSLGKVPVVCSDSPGFIVNRVARPFYIEALRLAEEGAIDFASIDRLLESRGFKMGPFKLMDLIGNDVNYAVSCSVYDQLNKPQRLRPSYIQKEKVEQGYLGRKTGKGYYDY
jgi:3-hydroxybutyryl-CoA dehydrogenase